MRALTWPFRQLGLLLARLWRWLTRPFRRLAGWVAATFDPPEPEEATISEAFGHTLRNPGDILPHLSELRTRIVRAVLALVAATAASFVFAQPLLEFLAAPVGGLSELEAIEITEPVGVYMRVSLLAGVTLAMPFILFQIYQFIAPGLKRNERRAVLLIVPFATLLFAVGLAFTYLVMLPPTIPFLLTFGGIRTMPRPDNYFKFVTGLMFWIGVAFQMPLVVYGLTVAGLVKTRFLAQNWRVAVVLIAVLAALVTPTVDPVTMAVVMAPLLILYFLSIVLSAVAERERNRRLARAG